MFEFDIALDRGSFSLQAALKLEQPVVGLFGPSGSGKSTLLGILAGTVTPDRGRIVVNGRCILDTALHINIPIHQRRVGLVFQDSKLFPHLSVKRNLEYGLNLLPETDKRFAFDQIVDLLELQPLLQQRPNQLSGGEKQRVALGRALLASPELLLLDEPMASLDERLKGQILPFLRRVKEQTRVPMIYVSHSINEILDLTQQLAVIHNGAILAHGDFHDIITTDKVLSLANSLGLDNAVSVELTEKDSELGYCVAQCGDNLLLLPYSELPVGSRFSVVIPASNIALAKKKISGTSIQNQIPGSVTAIRIVDHRALVTIDAGSILIAEITAKALRDMDIKVHDPVYCLIKTQAIRYFGNGE
ncbi:MAG TPA: molybdenum ABC transporter ATP-binding protein [Methylophilaceae bacterium]